MFHAAVRGSFAFAVLVVLASPGLAEAWRFSAGFEDGLNPPWGTGQANGHKTIWWNAGDCASTASADWRVRRNGSYALHILNPTARAAASYGTTQQPLQFESGHRYKVEVWALARNLASDGGVSLVVDDQWNQRPVKLPKGTYDWRPIRGEFTWNGGPGQCRILVEDRGEVWLDDISIVDLGPADIQ